MKMIIKACLIAVSAMLVSGSANAACWQWSTTSASNANADPSINWAEGQAPSSINDSARAMMARLAECRDDLSGKLTTGGTSTAYTVSTNQGGLSAPADGQQLVMRFHVANGAASTLVTDGGSAIPLQTTPGVAIATGTLLGGSPYRLTYSSAAAAWIVQNFFNVTLLPGSITTSLIADAAVTYAKIQNVAAVSLLGNPTGSAAPSSEITLGAGLKFQGTTITAPAFPPAGAFRNLVIKVATNTTINATADYVTTTNGSGLFQTTALACSPINMATTGINALDTGAIATSTWYAIWAVAKADGTTGCVASLQFTANGTFTAALPSGYTYYARVGSVRTASGVAQLLGTWQFGREMQYVVGLAQTTTSVLMSSAAAPGSVSVPTYVAVPTGNFVPPTATRIKGALYGGGGGTAIAAPNANFGSNTSTTNIPPVVVFNSGVTPFVMLLESTNIYWASNVTTQIYCTGWSEDGL